MQAETYTYLYINTFSYKAKSNCSLMKAAGMTAKPSYFILSGIPSEDTTFIFASICSVNEEQPIVK